MSRNEEALHNVRRKISEQMDKQSKRLVFGYYGKPEPTRKEGDEWNDVHGKKWTVKNGIKQSITKLQSAKTPWWCPDCGTVLRGLHLKCWHSRGMCYDCFSIIETKMKNNGTWEEFVKDSKLRNYVDSLKEHIMELQELHRTITSPEVIHADGEKILMVEKWDVNITKVKTDILDDIAAAQKHLDETIDEFGDPTQQERKKYW